MYHAESEDLRQGIIQQKPSTIPLCLLLSLHIVNCEDGGRILVRNFGLLLPDLTASHATIYYLLFIVITVRTSDTTKVYNCTGISWKVFLQVYKSSFFCLFWGFMHVILCALLRNKITTFKFYVYCQVWMKEIYLQHVGHPCYTRQVTKWRATLAIDIGT